MRDSRYGLSIQFGLQTRYVFCCGWTLLVVKQSRSCCHGNHPQAVLSARWGEQFRVTLCRPVPVIPRFLKGLIVSTVVLIKCFHLNTSEAEY